MIPNREKGLCHPDNRALLQLQHDEPITDDWWMPETPGAFGQADKGIRICNTPCPIRTECGQAAGGFGVWGGEMYGLMGRNKTKADRLGIPWHHEREAPNRPKTWRFSEPTGELG